MVKAPLVLEDGSSTKNSNSALEASQSCSLRFGNRLKTWLLWMAFEKTVFFVIFFTSITEKRPTARTSNERFSINLNKSVL